MKPLFAILILSGAAAAQIGGTPVKSIWTGTDLTDNRWLTSIPKQPMAVSYREASYLVAYETVEPCLECGSVYAVLCSSPGCAAPTKITQRFEPFASLDDAIAFLNAGLPTSATFLRLLKVADVPVKRTEQVTEIPQPAKVVQTFKYAVGK